MDSMKIVCNVKERKLPSGKGSLFLDLYIDGKREKQSLGLTTSGNKKKTAEDKELWALAEKIKSKTILEIAEGKYGFDRSISRKTCFVDYFRIQAEDQERRHKEGVTSAMTFHTYNSSLLHLQKYTGGEVRFSSVNEQWLEGFKKYLEETKMSPRTQSTYFSKIRAVINKAYRERVINYNPVPAVKGIAKGQSEKVFLLEEELEQLVKTPCSKIVWKRAFLFSCFTGLRLSDIEALTWSKVQGNTLNFRQKKTDGFEYLPLSKGALRILNQIKEELQGEVEQDQKVFQIDALSHRAGVLHPWFKEAGIHKPLTYHSSRHTFATLLLTKGVDLYTVSKLLGHQDIQTTLIYAKVIDKVKDNAVDLLPDFEE